VAALSIVIPAFNESGNVEFIYDALSKVLKKVNLTYEIIFVDDGSKDDTNEKVRIISKRDKRVRLISFSRNFGKEIATTAGIQLATGSATIIVDADGQHPVELIPEFIKLWKEGNKVIVGIRDQYKSEGFIKTYGSKAFYNLFNRFSGITLIPGSTDFRLIDKDVRQEFSKLQEQDRITRGLIDWTGFKKEYVHFTALDRHHGVATYTHSKLVKLALNSFISLSFAPLYVFGYLGLLLTTLSFIGGTFILIEQYILSDPLNLNISGAASLGILLLFTVGVLLISQGIMSLYISKIYAETKRRPLFIIDTDRSIL
jgi:glycosyltransferase involved in cell wall biosynthesis